MKEEARIRAVIETDPDTLELDDEWFAKARLASETHPRIVERYRRRRGKQRTPIKEHISIRLNTDLAAHFRASGPGWQSRLNDALRQAVFGRPD